MKFLRTHLQKVANKAPNQTIKGMVFENIVKLYLENDPLQKEIYTQVWSFAEWANKNDYPAQDTGIDLVAELADGTGLCAIQCKFYARDKVIDKKAIDSFMTASENSRFAKRLFVDTTDKDFGKNALQTIKNSGKPWQELKLHHLENSSVDWSATIKSGEAKFYENKEIRTHQQEALDGVIAGFENADRGNITMACGTGKTYTALQIAEKMCGAGKSVLYMVPSLALMSQSLREWKIDAKDDFTAFSVCSDTHVGKKSGDQTDLEISDLAIPATTNPEKLSEQIKQADKEKMLVVFCTYQSIQVISEAQSLGVASFDLIICDEAHRTTGFTLNGDDADESQFVRVHDNNYVAANKRLYMTATPKIYGKKQKAMAEDEGVLISMDDESIYGETFYAITFAKAVNDKLLSDYKVIILAVDESLMSAGVQARLSDEDGIQLDDATKIVGCYKALCKNQVTDEKGNPINDPTPMKRAVAFCSSIKISKDVKKHFPGIIDEYLDGETVYENDDAFLETEVSHVDGTFNAKQRNAELDWLAEKTDENTCRVLSNVRCLSEGLDVPALDAVIFMHPRKSQIEVVQSVGRVMRVSPGKQLGYVIIPVAMPVGSSQNLSDAMDNNERFKVIWQMVNALRSHDERLDGDINKVSLGENMSSRIQIMGLLADENGMAVEAGTLKLNKDKAEKSETEKKVADKQEQLLLGFDELTRQIKAKLVDKCGKKEYWDNWARDIGEIAQKHIAHIGETISVDGKEKKAFDAFLAELQDDLNPSVSQGAAIEMLAQHLITKPVFDTLFEDNDFTKNNPVSKAMETVLAQIGENTYMENSKSLNRFYESVKNRAQGITGVGRQALILELYDKFFKTAFPKVTEMMGIVYTPTEVVDFIIHSVDDVLKSQFGKTLGDRGVEIMDPFTGTGTFITRLLQSGIIKPEQMKYKYENEIHANEIILLAYYIADINIESVYNELAKEHAGKDVGYTPFNGIVLTDTFQLYEEERDMISNLMPDNSQLRTRQKERDIQVVIGNPPYSAGQKNANDDAQNINYPNLDGAIKHSYDTNSNAQLKRSLYDSYIRAFRWATDRITEKGKDTGIIGFVSGGGWIDGKATDGMRKCLADEFTNLYIFNLRGNIRKNMKSKAGAGEGGNIFGSGCMTSIAVSILVRDPNNKERGKIYYHDIGDDLTTEEKLTKIRNYKSIDGIKNWDIITPDENNDWLEQRDPDFDKHVSIGNNRARTGLCIFNDNSNGVKTNRDAWVYGACVKKMSLKISSMIKLFNNEVLSENTYKEVTKDLTKIKWSTALEGKFNKQMNAKFSSSVFTRVIYRPFQKSNLYFDKFFIDRPGKMSNIFPNKNVNNLIITTNANWSGNGQIALMNNLIPDLGCNGDVRAFPLKLYDWDAERDGISDLGLKYFQDAYPKEKISKEDLFYYIYGLLHSPEYQSRFKNNLSKELPRIPAVSQAKDFWEFSKAGRLLGDLHVNYENADLYPVELIGGDEQFTEVEDPVDYFRVKKMKFGVGKDKTQIQYSTKITIKGIPLEAYDYIVNGKSAIEWVMDRQCVKTHKDSGIENDANDYANETMNNPKYILELLQSVITVSVETMKIVNALPNLDIE